MKQLLTVFLAALLLFAAFGCTAPAPTAPTVPDVPAPAADAVPAPDAPAPVAPAAEAEPVEPATAAAPENIQPQAVPAAPETPQQAVLPIAGSITEAEAKAAALQHAGVKEADAVWRECHLDLEDGMQVYSLEFISGGMEYDYEIAAADGSIREWDKEQDDNVSPAATAPAAAPAEEPGLIGKEKARIIALAQVPGASDADIVKCKLDTDDGRRVYEIEIHWNGIEYDFEIDAASGDILKSESEPLDHD